MDGEIQELFRALESMGFHRRVKDSSKVSLLDLS